MPPRVLFLLNAAISLVISSSYELHITVANQGASFPFRYSNLLQN